MDFPTGSGISVMPPRSPLGGLVRTRTAGPGGARKTQRPGAEAAPAVAPCAAGIRGSPGMAAAKFLQGTNVARRVFWRADRGAEVHHRLREIAGPLDRHHGGSLGPDFGPCRWQRREDQ